MSGYTARGQRGAGGTVPEEWFVEHGSDLAAAAADIVVHEFEFTDFIRNKHIEATKQAPGLLAATYDPPHWSPAGTDKAGNELWIAYRCAYPERTHYGNGASPSSPSG